AGSRSGSSWGWCSCSAWRAPWGGARTSAATPTPSRDRLVLRYSVNQITLPGTTFEEDVRLLTGLGAPAVGVLRQKLARAGTAAAAKLLADAGLGVSVLLGMGGFRLEDPDSWPATI